MTSDMRGYSIPARGKLFPSNPAVDDQFYRTDRNLEYFFNGSYWLTTVQYVIPLTTYTAFPTNRSVTSNALMAGIPGFASTYDFWMEEMRWSSYVPTTNDFTHYWRCDLQKITAPSTSTNITSPTTASDTTNTWTQHTTTINALLGTSVIYLQINAVKVSGPGNLDLAAVSVVGRLVG